MQTTVTKIQTTVTKIQTTNYSLKTKMLWDPSLVDGNILEQDVESIMYNGVEYMLNIQVEKFKHSIRAAMAELRQLPSYDKDEEIMLSLNSKGKLSGTNAKWVRGSHPALQYRGNALKRHKVWFQEEGSGIFAYKYTGWQKRIMNATFRVTEKRFPETTKLTRMMKDECQQNHWIATVYEDGEDFIGLHSDKTKTWRRDSSFHVVKWGCPRTFLVTLKDHDDPAKCTVLFKKVLPEGTSIIVDSKTNENTRHGVPRDPTCTQVSGSIVGRDIETFHTFEEANKMIQQAKQDALKRKRKKEECMESKKKPKLDCKK